MATFHGVGVNWGVGSTLIGVNGAFQTRGHHFKQNSEEILDGGETTVSKAYWNQSEESTFTYVAIQPVPLPLGNAVVNLPTLGQWIQVVDTFYPRIAGFWLCDDIRVDGSNTSAVRVSVLLSRYPHLRKI